MASIKLEYQAGDAKPGLPVSFSPNRGYRWKVRGIHLTVTTVVAAGNRRLVVILAQDQPGPDGALLCDTGTVAANTKGVGEGGVSTLGFFDPTDIVATYVPWNVEPVVETWQGLTIVNPTAAPLQGGDTWTLRIHVEELPADGQDDNTDAA
jgi:hypothetical protein